MIRLSYISRAKPGFAEETSKEIALSASDKHRALGLTAIIAFFEGHFFQIIEGEEEHVRSVFASILLDHRHCDIEIVSELTDVKRGFKKWPLRYCNVASRKPITLSLEKIKSHVYHGEKANIEEEAEKVYRYLKAFYDGRRFYEIENNL